jgi:hypothetical protein
MWRRRVDFDVARVPLSCGAGASVPRGGRHGHDSAGIRPGRPRRRGFPPSGVPPFRRGTAPPRLTDGRRVQPTGMGDAQGGDGYSLAPALSSRNESIAAPPVRRRGRQTGCRPARVRTRGPRQASRRSDLGNIGGAGMRQQAPTSTASSYADREALHRPRAPAPAYAPPIGQVPSAAACRSAVPGSALRSTSATSTARTGFASLLEGGAGR